MNLSPLLDVCVSIVSLSLAGAVPVVVPKLLSLMHINATSQQEQSLENTITTSIGKALQYGQSAGDAALQNVTIKNNALNAAVNFAVNDAPVEMQALGYTPQSLAEVIDARITHALATKPVVVASQPPAPSPEAVKTAAMLDKVSPPVPAAPAPVAPATAAPATTSVPPTA